MRIFRNLVIASAMVQFVGIVLPGAADAASGDFTTKQSGKPFGLFNFPPDQVAEWPFTVTRLGGNMNQLDIAASKGLKAMVALTGSKKRYTDERGCFSLPMWQSALDETPVEELQRRIDNGTVIGLYAIDEPHDWAKFGSCKEVQYKDINAVCAYARKKWPNLPCGVNSPPGWLRKGLSETSFDQIGFLFFQYNTKRGDVNKWLESQLQEAAWFKGKLFVSTNAVANSPTAAELARAGEAMCKAPVDAVFMWRWPEAVDRPGIKEAMGAVARACAQSTARTRR